MPHGFVGSFPGVWARIGHGPARPHSEHKVRSSGMGRVHDEIERVRREKEGRELYEQLLWRIKVLGGDADLIDGENRRAFAEVLDAYVPENHSLVLNASERCRAANDDGGEIYFTGVLVTGGTATADLKRRLRLAPRVAEHLWFRVVPRYRGNRIAPRSLIRSVALYDQLGFECVRLRAAYSGTWYWAQWGFHFEDTSERTRMQEHAQGIIDALGGGLDATTLTHPIQFYRLGEPTAITFDELTDALPHRRDRPAVRPDRGVRRRDRPAPGGVGGARASRRRPRGPCRHGGAGLLAGRPERAGEVEPSAQARAAAPARPGRPRRPPAPSGYSAPVPGGARRAHRARQVAGRIGNLPCAPRGSSIAASTTRATPTRPGALPRASPSSRSRGGWGRRWR
jgi:hypothetical protein